MPFILTLESSSEVCSVAVQKDRQLIALVESSEPFSHTRMITSFISAALQESGIQRKDLSAVAVSDGPGSYTGLRVSAATAKGLCYGLNIPLISVNTLTALAANARETSSDEVIIPMIDARRMEVYYRVFDGNLSLLRDTDNIILEKGIFDEWLSKTEGRVVLCGTGIEKALLLFDNERFEKIPMHCSAAHLVDLAYDKLITGHTENIVSYEPNYFKAPKVTQSKKKPF